MVALGGPVGYYGRAGYKRRLPIQDQDMNDFIDNVSRILATPMPRRKAMKLFGGAFAAAVVALAGAQPAQAASCKPPTPATCGTGSNATCCKNSNCCYGTNGKSCCAGYLQGANCLSKKPSSGSYTSC
jgi:hypothetical protein